MIALHNDGSVSVFPSCDDDEVNGEDQNDDKHENAESKRVFLGKVAAMEPIDNMKGISESKKREERDKGPEDASEAKFADLV